MTHHTIHEHMMLLSPNSKKSFVWIRSNSTTVTIGSQDVITLIVDAIKSAVRFQKTISEAWLKVHKCYILSVGSISVLSQNNSFNVTTLCSVFPQAIESVEKVEDHKVNVIF